MNLPYITIICLNVCAIEHVLSKVYDTSCIHQVSIGGGEAYNYVMWGEVYVNNESQGMAGKHSTNMVVMMAIYLVLYTFQAFTID